MDAYHILVIILSVSLFIFLVLAIVAAVLFITVLKRADKITKQAEDVVDNIHSISSSFTILPFRQQSGVITKALKHLAGIKSKRGESFMKKDNGKKIAIRTAIGLAAGYVTGILTAPKSGKETRQDIKKNSAKVLLETEKELKELHKDLPTL